MVGESFATVLYYVREAVLVVGFLLYAALAQFWRSRSQLSKVPLLIAAFVLFAGCILALQISDLLAVRITSVLLATLLIGVSGGMVYECVALMAQQVVTCKAQDQSWVSTRFRGDSTRVLGLVVGGGGALAVVVHYVLQITLSLGVWLSVFFVICFALLMWLSWTLRLDSRRGNDAKGSAPSRVVPFICMVVATACLFALLVLYEVVLLGEGAVAYFYEWHRLFLVAGYIVIGALAFIGGRPVASIAVLIAMLFAIVVLMQTVMLEAGPITAILYYTLLGAIIAWSGIVFMSAAAQSSHSAFVASTGRILSEAVTVAGVLVPANAELPMMTVLVIALVMLAVVIVSMVKGGFLVFPARGSDGAEAPGEEDALTAEERVGLLARECDLTDREQEVLAAFVLTEDKNQQIADNLGISRRQLQTHISRIYEKTGTTTRAGLVMRVNDSQE